jgi:hypothetical protein
MGKARNACPPTVVPTSNGKSCVIIRLLLSATHLKQIFFYYEIAHTALLHDIPTHEVYAPYDENLL